MNIPELSIPHSREAEESLLGALLIYPDAFEALNVKPEHFYIIRNRWIFEAISKLRQRGHATDYVTISEELKNAGRLQESGGTNYLLSLVNATPSSLNAESYADIIRDAARRRNLINLANEIATTAHDAEKDIDSAIPAFMDRIAQSADIKAGHQSMADVMSALYDYVSEACHNPREFWGIPTGYYRFDRRTGGLQRGENMLLAGEPGVGKSLLALSMAANMAETAPGVVYSMEMKNQISAMRLVSGAAKITTEKMHQGKLTQDDWVSFPEAIEKFSSLPITMSDAEGWTTASLRADLARLKSQQGIQWAVIDYLFLLGDGINGRNEQKEHERIGAITRSIKGICKALNLAIITINSMTKDGINADRPSTTGQRGSAQAGYDADLAATLTNFPKSGLSGELIPEKDKKNMRVLWITKGRNISEKNLYVKLVQVDGFPVFENYSGDLP